MAATKHKTCTIIYSYSKRMLGLPVRYFIRDGVMSSLHVSASKFRSRRKRRKILASWKVQLKNKCKTSHNMHGHNSFNLLWFLSSNLITPQAEAITACEISSLLNHAHERRRAKRDGGKSLMKRRSPRAFLLQREPARWLRRWQNTLKLSNF